MPKSRQNRPYAIYTAPGANRLRDAHARLDIAIRAAYGVPAEADPLAFLLALNLELAAKKREGVKITPLALPLPAKKHAAYITNDCVQVTAVGRP